MELGAGALQRVMPGRPGALGVLMYHRIAEPDRRDPGLISATPGDFERQVAWLRERRPLVSLAEAAAAVRGEHELPRGAVLLTFDDACDDFLHAAWPVLRRHDAPAVVFVPTDFPGRADRAFWWDRVCATLEHARGRPTVESPAGPLEVRTDADLARARRAVRDWVWRTPHDEAMLGIDELVHHLDGPAVEGNVLGWDELRDLHRQGVAIGAHTRSHPRLDQLPLDRAVGEVLGSMADVEREIGSAPEAFAYPGGGLTDALVGRLRDAGVPPAFTTERGVADVGGDPLRLPRLNVGRRSSPGALSVQLLVLGARGSRHRRS